MTPIAEATIQRLDEARGRWWLFSMLCSVVLVVLISIAVLLVCVSADVLFQLSAGLLWTLLLLWAALSLTLVAEAVFRVLRRQRTLAAAARRVEDSFPELGNHLINLVQLCESSDGEPESFRQAAIAQALAQVRDTPFHAAASRRTRWARWRCGLQTPRDLIEFSVALAALLGLAYVFSNAVPTWSSSTKRLFTPWRFVPQVGAVRIIKVQPGEDVELLVGSRLDIAAWIENPGNVHRDATLYVASNDAPEIARPMFADAKNEVYSANIPAVLAPLKYRLQIGDSQSQIYRVDVCEKPKVDEFRVTYEYPDYLSRPQQTVSQKHGDLEAPQYTTAQLHLRCSSPISKGYVEFNGERTFGRKEDGRSLSLELLLSEPASYTIHLFNENGLTDPNPRVNTVRVIPDEPPTVEIVKPAHELRVAPGGESPVVIRAGDDYGLGEIRLQWKVVQEESAETDMSLQTARVWSGRELGGATATVAHPFPLDLDKFQPGQTLAIRALAVDRRRVSRGGVNLEPQETASAWRRIRLISPEEKAAEELAGQESVRARLWAILQAQLRTRVTTAEFAGARELTQALQLGQEIRRTQVGVQTATASLANSLSAEQGEEEVGWKKVLAKLARDEMLRAAQQAEETTKIRTTQQAAERARPLMDLQDQIIEALRKLLELTRRSAAATLAEMEDRPGGDLPDDSREKLRELDEKLRDFVEQQKRVIEATENLAKRPVDDFTEEEEQALKDLAAVEDKWSRFMQEAHSDFSKLPEQDFANPSLLEEFVEIQTEIEMAKDALTKKAADIAVPLEQLGAEMAEELITNLEKWLPDTPDRERWSQEEPLTEQMQEAPMAELPGELEDIVGELMEEEEDLFDEMEDVSSSWADSLDKGAGWDAMDGPISNMSAKGVTGNRLPNTSEISGRSGEGRQGKASGEFVGDTAVGKGGRKTPTRLAPDPQVKGQIKDYSKDPVGGATGGGKESGVGGAGLEGPVPARRQRDLQRLAQKQADLRRKGEAVDLKFQVLNYHHTDLKKLLDMMLAVEEDLRSGRYESALRRREVVLNGLGGLKTYLEGEFEIRRDLTTNLPEEIQKEILGSMEDPSPTGWEELNRKYFRRLATEEQPVSPPASGAAVQTEKAGGEAR